MKKRVDLVNGNIFKALLALSIPILGTSFIQMAYNMVDMIWIGRLGSGAVAAVGTAGFFTWFGSGIILVSKVGAEIGVAQAIGKDDDVERKKFVYNGLLINFITAIVYTILLIVFRNQLIGFFNLGDANIINMSIDYLVIVSIGMIFYFINPILTGIFNASGNSKTPFIINTIGLVFNIVFDPLLIFGAGPIPAMGVKGAAIATVVAQAIVSAIFIYIFIDNGYSFKINNKKYIDKKYINKICKLGLPSAIQNGLFSIFGMLIGRVVAQWGATVIAVQKVGSQIEAISWMTAGGFGAALTSFIGQNYGANKWDRILKGYVATIIMSSIIGLLATLAFVFAGESIFSIFIPEVEAIAIGKMYLRILGYSQLFMCLEITTAGAFAGLGDTVTPSIVGTILTGIRVPACIILAKVTSMGSDGVWWSISVTSMLKGIIVFGLFIFMVIIPSKKILKKQLTSREV